MRLINRIVMAKRFTQSTLILLVVLCLGACGSSSSEKEKTTPEPEQVSLSVKQFDFPDIQASALTTEGEMKAYVRIDGGTKREMVLGASGSEAILKLESVQAGEHYIEVIFEYQTAEFGTVTVAAANKDFMVEKGDNRLVIDKSDYQIDELDDDSDGVSNYAELTLPQATDPNQKNNFPPVFSTPTSLTYVENNTSAIPIEASDLNGHSLTYSIQDGVDQGLFSIDANSGELAFLSAPDYENALDANADNVYELSIEVTDEEGASSLLAIQIEVTDIGAGEQTQALSFDSGHPDAMFIDETFTLQVIATGEGDLSFESSNASVVSIDKNGNLKALSPGNTTITVSIAADNVYQAASASFSIDVVNQNFTLEAWIGTEGSEVSISSGMEGMEFYRSSDPDCDLENYTLCANPGMDIVDGNVIFDEAARLDQEGYYTFKWRDKEVSTSIDLEFPIRARHQVVVFKDKLWIVGGAGPSGGSENDVWSSSDGVHWKRVTAKAEFPEKQKHQVVVFDNKMWVIGGRGVWASGDGEHWTEMTEDAGYGSREEHQVVVFKNKLWLIGGSDGESRKNDIWSSKDGLIWKPEKASAEFSPRMGHQVVAFNNKLWLIGGKDDADLNNDDIWSSEDGINWVPVETGPKFSGRTNHQVVVYGNKLWLIGGFDVVRRSDVWTSEDGNTWELVSEASSFGNRYFHQAVVFQDKLWVSGGYGLDNDALWSSTDGIKWTWVLEDSEYVFPKRKLHQVVEFRDKLWLIGGLGSGEMNDVWTSSDGMRWYHENTDPTNQGVPVFAPRYGHQVVNFNNKLWLIGGRYHCDVWSSEDGINWSEEIHSAEFGGCAYHQVVEFKGRLWIIGGERNGVKSNEVWSSPNGIDWTLEAENPDFSARINHQVVNFSGKLWLIGGQTSYTGLSDIWSSEDGKIWSLVTETAPFSGRTKHRVTAHQNKLWLIGGGRDDIWSSTNGSDWKREFEHAVYGGRDDHELIEYGDTLYLIGGGRGGVRNDVWRFKNSTIWQRAYQTTIKF